MSRLNIYMPDELAERARERGLNISALAQAAVTAELARNATADWLAEIPVHTDRPNSTHATALDALDAARDELGW
ncbi:type II toxin-antitoxin system CcdA family antitoxin [Nocardia stercoris]|uniref:Antitoxin n=1 Tax=Nocardia stercoris TaxID=2483361 RepID=A0A3M2LFJ5_9NOCA|nr:antitoxin [Nocardia stercoris]